MTTSLLNAQETALNYAGAPTFSRSPRERTTQLLTVGTFGDTFYASKRELDAEFDGVMLEARSSDPEFLAKAAIFGRNQGLLKDAPTRALAFLAGGRGMCREPFEVAFGQVITIPDNLRKFAEACCSGTIPGKNGLGGFAAKAVARWLADISEYHALKYGSAASKGMTLRDLVRMTHPRPANAAVAERLNWLVRGRDGLGGDPKLNPQIRALEALKRATTEDEAVTLIREGRLPFEVAVPAVRQTTRRIWAELLRNAPYTNLLRNLVTFTRHGVFEDEDCVRLAAEKLASLEAIKRSKVMPFEFFNAWKRYTSGTLAEGADSAGAGFTPDSRLADTLRRALDQSFWNMPSFGNRKIAIGPDVSGSMSYGYVSERSRTRYIDICGIFAGALLRRVEDRAVLLPFDTDIRPNHGLSTRDDIMSVTDRLAGYRGGGTAVGAPVQYLLDRNIAVDAFIGITDNEDWAYGYGYANARGSFLSLWREYRAKVNPEAKAFLVTIAPYSSSAAPSGEPGVHFISGWSADVVKYIPLKLEGGESQLAAVRRIELTAKGTRQTSEDAQTDEELS